jgi:hypothetical protein
MIVNGRQVELDPADPAEHRRLVKLLAERLQQKPVLAAGPVTAGLAAMAAVDFLEEELKQAAEYRWLVDGIMATMPDKDAWDGDGDTASLLLRYVQHLAKATHGECISCGLPIPAGNRCEEVGQTGGMDPQPILAHAECA